MMMLIQTLDSVLDVFDPAVDIECKPEGHEVVDSSNHNLPCFSLE